MGADAVARDAASPLCSSASRGSTSRRPARAHGASMPCEGDHGRSRLRRRILGTVSRRLHFQDCGHARRGGERLVETEFAYQRDGPRGGPGAGACGPGRGAGGAEQPQDHCMMQLATRASLVFLVLLITSASWAAGGWYLLIPPEGGYDGRAEFPNATKKP